MADSSGIVTFRWAPGREVVAAPSAAWCAIGGPAAGGRGDHAMNEWLAADIADGLPHVGPETSGEFTPHMLNLDLLDGVSFSKGCYTGQEIVARTQHLGRVKRRTLRYVLSTGAVPAPMSGLAADGRRLAEALVASQRPDGVELLAVTQLDAVGRALQLEDGRTAEPRPLPYPTGEGARPG